jgi:hypothetical protein
MEDIRAGSISAWRRASMTNRTTREKEAVAEEEQSVLTYSEENCRRLNSSFKAAEEEAKSEAGCKDARRVWRKKRKISLNSFSCSACGK